MTNYLQRCKLVVITAVVIAAIASCASNEKKSTHEKKSVHEKKSAHQPAKTISYSKVPYAKLCSESFVDDYNGKGVSFKAVFVGEFTLVAVYQQAKMDTKGRIFINHLDLSKKDNKMLMSAADYAAPGFPLSIEKNKSDFVYEWKRGDLMEVKGIAEKVEGTVGKHSLHIRIKEIKKSP